MSIALHSHMGKILQVSKRSTEHLRGWIDGGINVIVSKYHHCESEVVELKPGDYVAVEVIVLLKGGVAFSILFSVFGVM